MVPLHTHAPRAMPGRAKDLEWDWRPRKAEVVQELGLWKKRFPAHFKFFLVFFHLRVHSLSFPRSNPHCIGQNRVTYSFNGANRICLKHICTIIGCARRRIVKLVRAEGVVLDGRGKHRNRTNKVSEEQREEICRWIDRFEEVQGPQDNLTLIYETWIATRVCILYFVITNQQLPHTLNSLSKKALTRKWFERFYRQRTEATLPLKRRRSSSSDSNM